jgi:hypothetical protein
MSNAPVVPDFTSHFPVVAMVLGFVVIVLQIANMIVNYFGIKKDEANVGALVLVVLLVGQSVLSLAGTEELIRVGLSSPWSLGLSLGSTICSFVVFLGVQGPMKRLEIVLLCIMSAWIATLANGSSIERMIDTTGKTIAVAEKLFGSQKTLIDTEAEEASALKRAIAVTDRAATVTEHSEETTKRLIDLLEKANNSPQPVQRK